MSEAGRVPWFRAFLKECPAITFDAILVEGRAGSTCQLSSTENLACAVGTAGDELTAFGANASSNQTRPDRPLSVSKADLRLIAVECRGRANTSHSVSTKIKPQGCTSSALNDLVVLRSVCFPGLPQKNFFAEVRVSAVILVSIKRPG